jgi:hypothetical protein
VSRQILREFDVMGDPQKLNFAAPLLAAVEQLR